MKVCPACNSVYGDDLVFCSNDGTTLVEENLPLPTEVGDDEPETVIRRNAPIVVDVEEETAAPPVEFVAAPVVIEKTSSSKYYAVFLLVGLVLGGGLVLATLLAAKILDRPDDANVAVQTKRSETDAGRAAETAESGNETGNETGRSEAEAFHLVREESRPDEEFNGRVIVENANVRAAPDIDAGQLGILPAGDRITIERRENASSPWYRVVCEHGVTGWMHGNTIEFTYGDF